MKCNREIRRESMQTLRSGWLWRILAVAMTLNFISQFVAGCLSQAFRARGIQTWTDFALSRLEALRSGLDYAVPSVRAAWLMTGASSFQTFILYLFGAIAFFGITSVAIKASRRDDTRWFADSMSGFRRPLGLLWLMVLANLRVFLWSLLFIVPGIVAIYRYRQAWYLAVEHPDWGASRCLAESAKMMRAHKLRAFTLDLSYLGWLLLVCVWCGIVLVLNVSGKGSAVLSAVGFVLSFLSIFIALFAMCHYLLGRAIFYRELRGA